MSHRPSWKSPQAQNPHPNEQMDAPNGAGGKCWTVMLTACAHEHVCIQDGDRFESNAVGNNLDIPHRQAHVPILQHKWTLAVT